MEMIKFLIFIVTTTIIFFLPQSKILFAVIGLCNIGTMILLKIQIIKSIKQLTKILPYIVVTFFINIIISNINDSIWIAIKFFIVCNITYMYSATTTKTTVASTIKTLCKPLVLFNVNIEEIEVMIEISLSIIPLLKKDLMEIKDVYKYKNIGATPKYIKHSMLILFIGLIKRTNQIDEALIAKGKKY